MQGHHILFVVVFIVCAISPEASARPTTSVPNNQDERRNEADRDNGDNSRGENNISGVLKRKDMKQAIKYMHKYGYLPIPNHPTFETPEMTSTLIRENVIKMQLMLGVRVTGELDDATLTMMRKPRCGVYDSMDVISIPDVTTATHDRVLQIQIPRHFVHYGQKWRHNNITYRILNFPHVMNYDDAYASIKLAFKAWSDVTPLIFTEVGGAENADLFLKFGRYEHGDPYPFDGRGGTLAHAFLPQSYQGELEGDIHFDDDEYFTYRSFQGINLSYIAAHEIGHALGLHHSLNPEALMAPVIKAYDAEFILHQDDIAGIQDLYGKPAPNTTNTDVNPTQGRLSAVHNDNPTDTQRQPFTDSKTTIYGTGRTSNLTTTFEKTLYSSQSSSLSSSSMFFDSDSAEFDNSGSDLTERCPSYYSFITSDGGHVNNNGVDGANTSSCNFTFDAVTSFRGEIFAFKNEHYWRITRDMGLVSPLNGAYAAYFFQYFPDDIDAAYQQYLTSNLLVFKGADYYVYDRLCLVSGPQPITDLDPSLPSDIDAVLSWGEWHKTYFFKGNLVWRYDEQRGRVDDGWPWLIANIWTGVPNDLTAAFRWGDYTYFLQGNKMYAYDDYCFYVNPRENPKSFLEELTNQQCL